MNNAPSGPTAIAVGWLLVTPSAWALGWMGRVQPVICGEEAAAEDGASMVPTSRATVAAPPRNSAPVEVEFGLVPRLLRAGAIRGNSFREAGRRRGGVTGVQERRLEVARSVLETGLAFRQRHRAHGAGPAAVAPSTGGRGSPARRAPPESSQQATSMCTMRCSPSFVPTPHGSGPGTGCAARMSPQVVWCWWSVGPGGLAKRRVLPSLKRPGKEVAGVGVPSTTTKASSRQPFPGHHPWG